MAWDLLILVLFPPRVIYRCIIWLEERPLAFRQARQEAGLCEKCGYDLCATPRQCPECGHRTTPTSRMFIAYRRQQEWTNRRVRVIN